MKIAEFQKLIEQIYADRDRERGIPKNFMWLAEEVGELSRALKKGEVENLKEEFADVLAWLCTLASLSGIDMNEAAGRYKEGCPYCRQIPCSCPKNS